MLLDRAAMAPSLLLWLAVAHCAMAARGPAGDLGQGSDSVPLAKFGLSFGLDVYRAVASAQQGENILLSPLAIAVSVASAVLGAESGTSEELRTLLHAQKLSEDALHSALSTALKDFKNVTKRNHTLKMGTLILGPSGTTLREDFVHRSREMYGTNAETSGAGKWKNVEEGLSKWVSDHTEGRVNIVGKAADLKEGLLLASACYFKGHWHEGFHPNMSDPRGFLVARTLTRPVHFMHRTGFYKLYDDEEKKLQVVEMPLAKELASVVILLPRQIEGLHKIEEILTVEQLQKWRSAMALKAVAVSLPRVSIEDLLDLQDTITKLGLSRATDKARSDLSGIASAKGLHVSRVSHGAAFEFGPEGDPHPSDLYSRKEMRSATLFYADRPFAFVIIDSESAFPLLIGRFAKPKGSGRHEEL
uniref:serpin H1-like isoform X2 n=1 Tax=Myxine glutinosa TaxID=7769 RepID=UPI00358F439E